MTYCGGCGAVGAMPYRCAGCKHVHYCSHACQKDGWRTMHRYTCAMHQARAAAVDAAAIIGAPAANRMGDAQLLEYGHRFFLKRLLRKGDWRWLDSEATGDVREAVRRVHAALMIVAEQGEGRAQRTAQRFLDKYKHDESRMRTVLAKASPEQLAKYKRQGLRAGAQVFKILTRDLQRAFADAGAEFEGRKRAAKRKRQRSSGAAGSERQVRQRTRELVKQNVDAETLQSLPPELLQEFIYAELSGADVAAVLSVSREIRGTTGDDVWRVLAMRDYIGPYRAEMAARKDDAEAPPELTGRPGWAPYERSTLFMTDEIFRDVPLSDKGMSSATAKVEILNPSWTWRRVYQQLIKTAAADILQQVVSQITEREKFFLAVSIEALRDYDDEIYAWHFPSMGIKSPRYERTIDSVVVARLDFPSIEDMQEAGVDDLMGNELFTRIVPYLIAGKTPDKPDLPKDIRQYLTEGIVVMPAEFEGQDLVNDGSLEYVGAIRKRLFTAFYTKNPIEEKLRSYLHALMWHVDPTLQVCMPVAPGHRLNYWETDGIADLDDDNHFPGVYLNRADAFKLIDPTTGSVTVDYTPLPMKRASALILTNRFAGAAGADVPRPPEFAQNFNLIPSTPDEYPVTFYDFCVSAYSGEFRPNFLLNDKSRLQKFRELDKEYSREWSYYRHEIEGLIYNLLVEEDADLEPNSSSKLAREYIEWAAGPRVMEALYGD